MNYSSLTLKNNTHSRVTMLMDKDFLSFKSVRDTGLIEETKQSFRKIFAKKSFLYTALFAIAMMVPTIEMSVAAAEIGETKTFIATAYYSPVP